MLSGTEDINASATLGKPADSSRMCPRDSRPGLRPGRLIIPLSTHYQPFKKLPLDIFESKNIAD
jgi:hypothetical protein